MNNIKRYFVIGIIFLFFGASVIPSVYSDYGEKLNQNLITNGPDDAVAHWSFDDESNPGYDDSGNDHNGTVYGAIWVDGKNGGGLDFDGEDDYVEVLDSDDLDLTDDFTIEMWVYPRDFGRGGDDWYYNQQWLICKHKAFENNQGTWGIANGGTRLNISFEYQGQFPVVQYANFTQYQWTHVACTYDDTTDLFCWYINGTLDVSETADMDIQNTVRNLFIGCEETEYMGYGTWHHFNGTLDDIVIYNRVLMPYDFWGLQVQPDDPIINGPSNGKPNTEYDFAFNATDANYDAVMYNVDWGDGNTEFTEYGDSGSEILLKHTWDSQGTFTIKAQAIDIHGAESEWSEFPITIPRNKAINNPFLQFFKCHPNIFPVLQLLLQKLGL